MNTSKHALSAAASLVSLALEMHAQMTIDTAPFNMAQFARQMADFNMILSNVDLLDYEMLLIDALSHHSHRVIPGPMIQKIYRNLFVLQNMAKKAQS